MKKFFLGFGLSFILLSAIWMTGIQMQLGVGTSSSRWVFDAYQAKIAAAKKQPKNRTLIVAGSNAMFGINSSKLESYWQRPTINLGVNAGLGLPYILYLAKQTAQPGDVILMPMEYALYLDHGDTNAQVIDYVLARDVDYLKSLPQLKYWEFMLTMSPERWVQGLQLRRAMGGNLTQLNDVPVTSGTYGAHHLDVRGDQTHSSALDRVDANKAAVANATIWHYGARALKEDGGWDEMAAFALWAKQNRICVIAVPTVLLHYAQYDADPVEKNFYDTLPQKISTLGIPFVGKPRDFMYPPDRFFDTDHHLQDWARDIHTDRLIQLLKPDPLSYCQ